MPKLFTFFLVLAMPAAALAQTAPVDPDATDPEAEEEEQPQTSTTTTTSEPGTAGATLATPTATEEEAPEVEHAAPQPRPYRGSIFYWQQGITVNTLNPDAQLTYNPTYYWYFLLQPRWYVDPQNFFVLTAGLSLEFTDSDTSTTQYEPQLSDTVLEWRHTEAVEGFVFIPSVRLAAPTSLASIAAERIINTGVGLTTVRVFPEAANLTLALAVGYRHWWAASNVVTGNTTQHCLSAGVAATDGCIPGPTTERDRLSSVLTATVSPFAGFTVTMQYALIAVLAHDLAAGDVTAIGGPSRLEDMSATHWRGYQYWALGVAYDVVPWLNLALFYQSASSLSPLWNDDASVRNPFYNPDSELYLAATLAFDVLVEEVEGDTGEEPSPELRQRRRQGLAQARPGLSF